MFTLNDTQRNQLAQTRAWAEDGERRFEFWSRRAAREAATDAFAQTLAESGLRSGRALTVSTRVRLLRLALALGPNPNLSRRLYAENPADFDRRLRGLFFGEASLLPRLREFLAPRGVGPLTASQLLCAFAPQKFPLLSRPAQRRLDLSASQKRDALTLAGERFGFDVPEKPDAAMSLLASFVVCEAVRDTLGVADFPEADALLRDAPPLAFVPQVTNRVAESGGSYDAFLTPTPALTESKLLAALEDFVAAHGFVFPPFLLRSYYVGLKSKPFAILSGISGTGKTKMAELFAETLTGRNPEQFRLIAVRPDWADSTALFGYQNPLSNAYVSTPFLDLLRAAALPENRHKAFFVCLDEMNLARVEYYLADFLSALESRSHRIALHSGVPDAILTPNSFVTGTVNRDETTHPFSRKVLDRAATLDFDSRPNFDAHFGKGVTLLDEDLGVSPAERQRLFLSSRLTSVAHARERLTQISPDFPARALRILQNLNDLLHPHALHFAFRTRDEILLFLAHSFDAETRLGLFLPDAETNFQLALDLQITQRILPKLSGPAEILTPVLEEIEAWATRESLTKTAERVERMRTRGEKIGDVGFYE